MSEESSKKGRSSRNKGANGERELANLLKDFYGFDVRRGQVFNGEPDLVGLDGIHVEVKRVERLNINDAMEQAREAAKKKQDGVPVVFHRRNRTRWMVTMDLQDWVDFYLGWLDDEEYEDE